MHRAGLNPLLRKRAHETQDFSCQLSRFCGNRHYCSGYRTNELESRRFRRGGNLHHFSVFYDGLADHGDWIDYDGDYVFVPVVSDRDWRPYREGHWIYARGYGWTWVSDEPFGWATYHYGRWGFDEEIGWYWVPGTRWAPAG